MWLKLFRDPLDRLLCSLGEEGGGGGGQGAGGQGAGGAGGAGAGGGQDPWYHGFKDKVKPDTLAWLDGKKFQGLEAALDNGALSDRMYRERNVMPRPDADPAKLKDWEGWGALGWNADKAAYAKGITPPRQPNGGEHDAGLFDAAVGFAHEHRMTPGQAQGFIQNLSDFVNGRLAEAQSRGIASSKELDTALRGEWGDKYNVNVEMATRAAKAFGLGADTAAELEKLVGSPRLLKFMHALGAKLGEGNLVQNDGGGSAGTSPATAEAEIRRLEGDPEFIKAFTNARHPAHLDAKAKYDKLIETMAKSPTVDAARGRIR
jgi:hypothetical protein